MFYKYVLLISNIASSDKYKLHKQKLLRDPQ